MNDLSSREENLLLSSENLWEHESPSVEIFMNRVDKIKDQLNVLEKQATVEKKENDSILYEDSDLMSHNVSSMSKQITLRLDISSLEKIKKINENEQDSEDDDDENILQNAEFKHDDKDEDDDSNLLSVNEIPQIPDALEQTHRAPTQPTFTACEANELLDCISAKELALIKFLLQNESDLDIFQLKNLHDEKREEILEKMLQETNNEWQQIYDEAQNIKDVSTNKKSRPCLESLIKDTLMKFEMVSEDEEEPMLMQKNTEISEYNYLGLSESTSLRIEQADIIEKSLEEIKSINLAIKQREASKIESSIDSINNQISFDEEDLIVRVYLTQNINTTILDGMEPLESDEIGMEKFTLAEIKKIFFNKKRHCKLDWQFIYWDIKIKKIKKEYMESGNNENRQQVIKNTKNFINCLRFEFNCNKTTFDIVIDCFTNNKYPFNLKIQQKQEFDSFMLRYVIDESYSKQNPSKFYCLDDIFEKKRPKFRKFQKNYEIANRRICNTYDKLGQLHHMKDKVGQKFETILIKQLRDLSEVEFYPLTDQEAFELNKQFKPEFQEEKKEEGGGSGTDRSKVTEKRTYRGLVQNYIFEMLPQPPQLALGWVVSEEPKIEKRKKFYFKAKFFKFENVYQSYDKEHECLRFMDFNIVIADAEIIKDLEIIQFLHHNNVDNTPLKIIMWEQIRPFLKGIGTRKWFLHYPRLSGRFRSGYHIKRGILSHNDILDRTSNNLLVSLYHGIIREGQKYTTMGSVTFGRSIYCNYDFSYYIGYMNGMERHSKGLLYRNGKIHQQGFYIENKVEKENNFEIVDLRLNLNYQDREDKLVRKIASKKEKRILSFSDVEAQDSDRPFVSISDCNSSETDFKRLDINKTELLKRFSENNTVRTMKRINSGEIRYQSIINLRSNEGGEQEDFQNEIKEFITKQNYKYTDVSDGSIIKREETTEEVPVEEPQQEINQPPKQQQSNEVQKDCNIF